MWKYERTSSLTAVGVRGDSVGSELSACIVIYAKFESSLVSTVGVMGRALHAISPRTCCPFVRLSFFVFIG